MPQISEMDVSTLSPPNLVQHRLLEVRLIAQARKGIHLRDLQKRLLLSIAPSPRRNDCQTTLTGVGRAHEAKDHHHHSEKHLILTDHRHLHPLSHSYHLRMAPVFCLTRGRIVWNRFQVNHTDSLLENLSLHGETVLLRQLKAETDEIPHHIPVGVFSYSRNLMILRWNPTIVLGSLGIVHLLRTKMTGLGIKTHYHHETLATPH